MRNRKVRAGDVVWVAVLCVIRPFPFSNIDFIFTSVTRSYTPASIVTLILNVYVVVISFYFSMFQLCFLLLLSVHNFCICLFVFCMLLFLI